jgi:hypothetical protein
MLFKGKFSKKVVSQLLTTQKLFKHDIVTKVKFLFSEGDLSAKLQEKGTKIFESSTKSIYYDSDAMALAKKVFILK